MSREAPALRLYRRVLVAFVLIVALLVAGLGGWLVWNGHAFLGVLALLLIGFLVLVAHGYRQDERERS